jgi:hypothetical protein
MSQLPKGSNAASTSAEYSVRVLTSAATAIASPPPPVIYTTTASARSGVFRSLTTTRPPTAEGTIKSRSC